MSESIQQGALPVPHDAVIFRTVSDGAVLLHTDAEIYYGLNAVGARIWQLLPESDDVDDLCSRLAEHYPDVERNQLRGDVVELLEALGRNELLVGRR